MMMVSSTIPRAWCRERAIIAGSFVHCRIHRRFLKTLALSCGPTSLKYSVYDVPPAGKRKTSAGSATLIAHGLVDQVGKPSFSGGVASMMHNKSLVFQDEVIEDHSRALQKVLQLLEADMKESNGAVSIECVGHKIAHGGPLFCESTRITPDFLQTLSEWSKSHSSVSPNDAALAGIEASLNLFPDAAQVALFDTAFHTKTMPPASYQYAIPQHWYQDYQLRRYGGGGIQFQEVLNDTAAFLSKEVRALNVIAFHLEFDDDTAGSSICCIKNGLSIDTTASLSGTGKMFEGLVQGKQPGDIDFGIVSDLIKEKVLSLDQITHQLQHESGLWGLSGGVSSDMRIIQERALQGDVRCRLARQIFVERCRKYLGAYYLKLRGKVDAIVFSGALGESDAALRSEIVDGLDQELQIAIDPNKNGTASKTKAEDHGLIFEVHPAFSKTKVLVLPVKEERSIAIQASEVLFSEMNQANSPVFDSASLDVPRHASTSLQTNLFCHSVGHTYTGPEELGLLSVFSASADRVGYFRPIGRGGAADYRIQLMKQHIGLRGDGADIGPESADSMFGIEEDEAWELMASGKEDELFERILQKYLAYAADKDFVLVSTFTEGDDSLHFAAKLCSALNIPAILIGNAINDTQFGIDQAAFQSHGANCVGAIISDVDDPEMEKAKLEGMKLQSVALLPPSDILMQRSMEEVMKVLDNSVCLYGKEYLDCTMDSMRIYTVQVDDLLELVKDDELAIVHQNRIDSLMALLLAAQSSNASTPAGILFTLYDKDKGLNSNVASLLDGLKDIRIPVLATSMDTIDAAKVLDQTPPFISADSKAKVDEATTRMQEHFDYSFLGLFQNNGESSARPQRDIGPRLFQYSTFLKARKLQKTIILPEGADPRVVEAASILVKRQLCKVLLVGDPAIIDANAKARRVSLDGVTVVDPQNYDGLNDMISAFVEARKSKGLTAVKAEQHLLQDVNYFGTLMMHLGLADGMVSGAMHSSANTIRPALQVLKTAPGVSLVSSIFFMLLEDGVKVFGDCAINTAPNSEQLAEIALASAKTAQQFGIDPRVALLSYATGESNKGELIEKVINATNEAKDIAKADGFMDPSMIAGPMQFDAAVDPAVAAIKAKYSLVAGRANVLIFPDLNAGNNGYKAVQQVSKTIAIGPILQGLRKPVNDLSRGATVDDIVNTAVITALQAVNSGN